MLSYSLIWTSVASVIGAILGFSFAFVWLKVSPKGTSTDYLSQLFLDTYQLFKSNNYSELLKQYAKIIASLFKHLKVQLLALLLSSAPIIINIELIHPKIEQLYLENFTGYTINIDNHIYNAKNTSIEGEFIKGSIIIGKDFDSTVLTHGNINTIFWTTMGFRVIENKNFDHSSGSLFIRKGKKQINPLWPFFNDLEFSFIAILGFVSILTFIKINPSGKQNKKLIAPTDMMLSQIANDHSHQLVKLSELETRRYKIKFSRMKIQSPIFVCGLARSGSTLLLEKMATYQGLSTHQYRDFPFVMTPILWNRFTSLFTKERASFERPHGDGLYINRNSPDAFEEVIWMHYFKNLHRWGANHVLDEHVENTDFESFYKEHIKKILLLRKGTRYLSKGNYNVLRIPYLQRIFPDAKFIIPIRCPSAHIAPRDNESESQFQEKE